MDNMILFGSALNSGTLNPQHENVHCYLEFISEAVFGFEPKCCEPAVQLLCLIEVFY